jgi:glycosyltransferase involved in cell wall biosynthesis
MKSYKNIKVSICIPTYDKNGSNLNFIENCINSCISQDYENFNIVVSDHSPYDGVHNLLKKYDTNKIKYFKYEENLGWPAHNTNNAIKKSDGDLIKIMNQDDYFSSINALTKMVEITENNKWSLISFTHLDNDTNKMYNPMTPKINGDGSHLLLGINTVGCPSVGLFPNDNYFDPYVTYMIDCELWYKLYKKYGEPGVVNDYGLIIRTGSHNLTSLLKNESNEMMQKDINYLKQKYNS